MKTRDWIIVILIGLALGLCVSIANAGDTPEGVEVFQVGDHTCVLYSGEVTISDEKAFIVNNNNAVMECFCSCELSPDCNVSPNGETPVPSETPPPKPTKEKCNSGRGNGSEGDPDCDPGNSAKNKGGD